jgi:hypothetical protein
MKNTDEIKEKYAVYRPLTVAGLAGNPLAEAIPLRLSMEEFWEKVSDEISVPENINNIPDEDKELHAMDIMNSVSPTSLYYDVYCDLLNLLRMGYRNRNPLCEEWKKKQHILATQPQKKVKTTGGAISFFGLSGMGKTTLVDSALSQIDQVITHSKDGRYELEYKQIVYLKCDIAGSDDPKEVCLKVLAEIDKITGENVSAEYRRKKHTTKNCIHKLVTRCSTLNIGMLIFDEVQNIELSKPSARKQLFSLFHKLNNESKIPVVSIGTSKASEIFQDEFTNVRRLGQPVEFFNYSPNDDDWMLLVDYAWDYQLIKKPLPLSPEIEDQIYQLTWGIPYCLFYLMEQANIQAIRKGIDSIDIKFLKDIYETKFKFMQPALMALRSGNTDAFDDMYNIAKNLNKDHKILVKDLLKKAHQYKLKGPDAKTLLDQIKPYLVDYKPTIQESRTVKSLTKESEIVPSEITINGNEMEMPI